MYFIRLDKKGRLVLPLEIRDALRIKNGDRILLSVSSADSGKVVLEVAKAPERIESDSYSRNGSYVRDKFDKNLSALDFNKNPIKNKEVKK